mmetsp:Transcript_31264/g.75226  ORF Transcript_31264/g.75226 Transcript_31264/m.75226 type:complete len:208 (-) Transcript_31264:49-672(-)
MVLVPFRFASSFARNTTSQRSLLYSQNFGSTGTPRSSHSVSHSSQNMPVGKMKILRTRPTASMTTKATTPIAALAIFLPASRAVRGGTKVNGECGSGKDLVDLFQLVSSFWFSLSSSSSVGRTASLPTESAAPVSSTDSDAVSSSSLFASAASAAAAASCNASGSSSVSCTGIDSRSIISSSISSLSSSSLPSASIRSKAICRIPIE